jgi:hypothetical protein
MSDIRAQASVEYLTLFGSILIIVALLAGYSLVVYSETIAGSQIQSALDKTTVAAKNVYSIGEGNSLVIEITLPSGVNEFTANEKHLLIRATTFSTNSSTISEFDFNVSGSLPTSQGTYDIEVKNVDGAVTFNVI